MKTTILLALITMIVTPAAAQDNSPFDLNVQLSVCRDMRAIYISDSEKLQTLLRQASARIAELEAKLKEAQDGEK